MKIFRSIEERYGVDEPGYEPPRDDEEITLDDAGEYPHTLTYPEVIAAIVLPIVGLGVAVWRFGRGDIGPGFANLVLAAAATIVWTIVLMAA